MLIRNLIKTADDGNYNARADRSLQSARVLLVDRTAGQATLDVGMVDANGNPVYMQGVAFSPQSPPRSQDNVALMRTNSSPYSMVIGSGQVGGANSGQVVTSAGVNSVKKTGETTGQQGDLELEAGNELTLTRSSKKFTFARTKSTTIGGLQQTGVSLVQDGSSYYYYYNSGVASNQSLLLPNLILASGSGQAIDYTFVNFSDYNVTVTANTTTYTNYIEDSVASIVVGPGEFFTIRGIQATASDGKWRTVNHNTSLHTTLLQTGTSYTLALGDLGRVVAVNNASAVTVTVPTNASVKFPIGALVDIRQTGAGLLTLAAAGGVTLRNWSGLSAPAQYATFTINKIAADEWIVVKDSYGGMVNPMTTSGDIITGGAAGAPARLAIGSNGNILTLTAGAVGWAAPASSSGSPSITANAQSGTTYTLALTDAGKIIEITNASATTVTVPPNSSVAFTVGTTIEIWQGGAIFATTIAAGGGVTLLSRGGLLNTNGQYAIVRLRKQATDTWQVSGDRA